MTQRKETFAEYEKAYREFEKGFCETGGDLARKVADNLTTTVRFFETFRDIPGKLRDTGREIGSVFRSGALYGGAAHEGEVKKTAERDSTSKAQIYAQSKLRSISNTNDIFNKAFLYSENIQLPLIYLFNLENLGRKHPFR
jgi:hypothetical protein